MARVVQGQPGLPSEVQASQSHKTRVSLKGEKVIVGGSGFDFRQDSLSF